MYEYIKRTLIARIINLRDWKISCVRIYLIHLKPIDQHIVYDIQVDRCDLKHICVMLAISQIYFIRV